MKYKAKYLSTARKDREEIKAYLNQFSSKAYARLVGKIRRNIEYAKTNPYMYEVYERRPKFRRMVVEDYLVFYKINESERLIEVHHILHGMIDIQSTIQ